MGNTLKRMLASAFLGMMTFNVAACSNKVIPMPIYIIEQTTASIEPTETGITTVETSAEPTEAIATTTKAGTEKYDKNSFIYYVDIINKSHDPNDNSYPRIVIEQSYSDYVWSIDYHSWPQPAGELDCRVYCYKDESSAKSAFQAWYKRDYEKVEGKKVTYDQDDLSYFTLNGKNTDNGITRWLGVYRSGNIIVYVNAPAKEARDLANRILKNLGYPSPDSGQ